MFKKLIATSMIIAAFAVAPAYASDCTPVAQKVAADQGGELNDVKAYVQDGRDMCLVVVIIPGHDGEKPRRVEVAVPAK